MSVVNYTLDFIEGKPRVRDNTGREYPLTETERGVSWVGADGRQFTAESGSMPTNWDKSGVPNIPAFLRDPFTARFVAGPDIPGDLHPTDALVSWFSLRWPDAGFGPAHITVDDGNYEDDNIRFCLNRLAEWCAEDGGTPQSPECLAATKRLLERMLEIPEDERCPPEDEDGQRLPWEGPVSPQYAALVAEYAAEARTFCKADAERFGVTSGSAAWKAKVDAEIAESDRKWRERFGEEA